MQSSSIFVSKDSKYLIDNDSLYFYKCLIPGSQCLLILFNENNILIFNSSFIFVTNMKSVQRIILLIVAVTVFFTGAGVTIINYCCTSCSGQTLFMTEKHQCCSASEHSHNGGSCCALPSEEINANACEGMAYANDTHCTTSRLSIDIDASSFRPQISIPFVWVSDAIVPVLDVFVVDSGRAGDLLACFSPPPDITPREYLSFIQVLII